MRITHLQPLPLHYIPYLTAGPGGCSEKAQLPVLEGSVDVLPAALDAILCASDLQGVEITGASVCPRLLGEVLAEELIVLMEMLEVHPHRIGIVLAGDFYSAPGANQRGASGDVSAVWHAFRQYFRWVVGVAGNHDTFGTAHGTPPLGACSNVHLLDGDTVTVDGLGIAGIGGITGSPTKPMRRDVADYHKLFSRLVRPQLDLLVLHQSPEVSNSDVQSPDIGRLYHHRKLPLTVGGHHHWPDALIELPNGNQLLNVDSRAVLLRRAIPN